MKKLLKSAMDSSIEKVHSMILRNVQSGLSHTEQKLICIFYFMEVLNLRFYTSERYTVEEAIVFHTKLKKQFTFELCQSS